MLSSLIVLCNSCNIKDKKTMLKVADADRHYYPILRGQTLDVLYEIENTGENPLFISSIKTSCGCMLIDDSSFKVLPAGGKGFVKIKYDSKKNIGYVKHYITIHANLTTEKPEELTFDVHVVPNALYTKDYEELYSEHKKEAGDVKSLVDGSNNLGYYLENDELW